MAVTSTNNLRKGMKDSNGSTDVLDLQKALNSTGWYNLDLDGSYGSKTEAAVKDYQTRMGLKSDGIVGTNTWGALTKSSNSSTQTQTPAQPEVKAPTFEYTESDAVSQANALLQQHMSTKPGEWQGGTWYDSLNDTINQILNREKFSYDLNGDMLYQQYKDQYTTQGKLAMMDTMGQAAAMTGGYGNSYAQTAGQQAYQGYLQQLNDKVPELYQLALNQYNQEEQALYDQASLMAGMEEQEYGRYRDSVSDYYTELANLKDNARYMSEDEYNKALQKFNIEYSSYWDQTNYDYQVDRDKVADQQWQATFDEGVRQYNTSLKEEQRQYNLSYQQKQDEDQKKAIEDAGKSEAVASFKTKMGKDTEHWDAIMRHQYGSEKTYIAQQIEKSTLTDNEKAYLISFYGITESDLNYKNGHS